VTFTHLDLYCTSQLCYEMINVEEESQIVAFYSLINQNYSGERLTQEQVDEKYTQVRKQLRDNLTK
jgi:asparagine synthetase A